jgi:PAS domain S-box-containing protein
MLEFKRGHPILDSIADGVFTVDSDFKITSFNRAAEEITGYDRTEAIGRPCREIFRASVCESDCVLCRSIETGRQLVNVRVDIHNRMDERVPISVSTAVLYDRRGKQIGGVETFRDLTALNELRRQIDHRADLQDVVGRHPSMKRVLEIVPEVASSGATVLIQGPSGSGKGLIARTIHNLSPRRGRPFVTVNCAALPETLLESELFGYVKGAFTDARKDKPGRIALAEGGTLFLDEIGDIPPMIQVKLLHVVQDREYEPLGSTKTRIADVRVVAATNRNLKQLIRRGEFREDLYYRLHVVDIQLPSLAERRTDIPRLVDRILRSLNIKLNKNVTGLSDRAMALIMAHDFPGNVRELENVIEHALVLCRGSLIMEKHLPAALRPISVDSQPRRGLELLEDAESAAIRAALARFGGRKSEAAKALGVHRTTLWRKMQRYGL